MATKKTSVRVRGVKSKRTDEIGQMPKGRGYRIVDTKGTKGTKKAATTRLGSLKDVTVNEHGETIAIFKVRP
jgi:hypothetical protein